MQQTSPFVYRYKVYRESGEAENVTTKVLKLDAEDIEAGAAGVCTSLCQEDQQDTLVGNGEQKDEEAESRGEEDGGEAVLTADTQPPHLTHASLRCQCSSVRAELLYTDRGFPFSELSKNPKINVFACFCLSASVFAHIL